MQQKSINLFVSLLESIVQEASSSAQLIGRIPGADVLIPYMHKERSLAHDQTYDEVKKISWSEIKNTGRYGNKKLHWVLVRGERGLGAIAAGDSYQAMAVDADGEVVKKISDKGGTILDWLKEYIGKLQAFYVGKATGEVGRKRTDRKASKPLPVEQYTDIDTFTKVLMKKFKPLWVKALVAAQADIKGFVGNQIKNNAFDKANKKIERLKYLDMMISKIEDGEDPASPGDRYNNPFTVMTDALHNAILMTAHHFYPDNTGGFTARTRGYGSTAKHSLVRQDGIRMLFDAIRGGDTSKLGTLLAFFKKGLISG